MLKLFVSVALATEPVVRGIADSYEKNAVVGREPFYQ